MWVMHRIPRSFGALVGAFVLAACGGSTESSVVAEQVSADSGVEAVPVEQRGTAERGPVQPVVESHVAVDSGADGGVEPSPGTSADDASQPASDSGVLACPTTMPTDGAQCPCAFSCEYGNSPELRCNTLMTGSHGQWTISRAPATTGCDADAGSPVVDAGVGCPAVRPHIGTPCATANQSCDYDACEGNVNLECVGGLWEDAPIECGSQAQ